MASSIDAFRARFPLLSCALYALEPGGPVTFEVVSDSGQSFTFNATTADEAVALAMPPEPAEEPQKGVDTTDTPDEPTADVFG